MTEHLSAVEGGMTASGDLYRLLVQSVMDYAIFVLSPSGVIFELE